MDAPRAAAAMVVVRAAAGAETGGIEVLVARRSTRSRFAPGYVVFPGGALDPGDDGLALAWFGEPARPSLSCALRELVEEVGLSVAGCSVVEAPERRPRVEPPLPDLAAFHEMARWVAPEFLPVRFDARFFAVVAGPGLRPSPDGVEIDDAWWARPGDVVRRSVEGSVSLAWPTLCMLEALTACRTVDEALDLRVSQVPPPLERSAP
ncbi:MAG TPA: NUDIX domain-containing protein [Actinomycetota bacterium]|jgi:8-oxo-dGTP pyrophosphatase MutT (NUDIX family)